MTKTVYIDILFLINFSMDFLCFYISAKIMSVKLSTARAIVAAVLGGIYSGVALFLPMQYFLSLLLDLLVCFVLCAITFGRKNGLFFSSIVYFSVSMALGGFMTALFNLFNRLGFSSHRGEVEEDGISVWLFALLALASAAITLCGGRFFRRNAKLRRVDIRICEGKEERRISALVDSGNLLREPISGSACIVLDIRTAKGLFDDALLDMASGGVPRLDELPLSVAKRVRVVPSTSATGEGMLLGVRAEGVFITVGERERRIDALIVFSRLDGKNGAKALVPLELID